MHFLLIECPVSVLYSQRAPYSFPLCVFGCLSFIHNYAVDAKKLDPKVIRVIFFGYPPTQKGYKCCNPKTRKWYVSRNVTFIEHVSYFTWTSPQREKCDDKDEEYSNEQMIQFYEFVNLKKKRMIIVIKKRVLPVLKRDKL